MSITILGEHIRLIREEKWEKPRQYKDEHPRIKHRCRSKIVKEHTGKVVKTIKVGNRLKLILEHGGEVWANI